MWLVVALALAADPPAPAPQAPAPARLGGAELRRTCSSAQLCDGRCIPWSDPCEATLRASVDAMAEVARAAELSAIVCGPSPFDTPVRTPTIEAELLTQLAASALCTSERESDPEACDPDPATRDVPLPRPVTRPPTCRQAPPVPTE